MELLDSCADCKGPLEETAFLICGECKAEHPLLVYDNNYKEVKQDMATLKQEAESYQPPQIFNIADLPEVSVDFEIYEKKDKNAEGEEYTYKYLDINGKKYRTPSSVLEEIQKILKIKPEAKTVKVSKTGEGLKTRYSVELIA